MQDKQQKKPCAPLAKPVQQAVNVMKSEGRGEILSDILGSYTGTAENGEVPEQDADDL